MVHRGDRDGALTSFMSFPKSRSPFTVCVLLVT